MENMADIFAEAFFAMNTVSFLKELDAKTEPVSREELEKIKRPHPLANIDKLVEDGFIIITSDNKYQTSEKYKRIIASAKAKAKPTREVIKDMAEKISEFVPGVYFSTATPIDLKDIFNTDDLLTNLYYIKHKKYEDYVGKLLFDDHNSATIEINKINFLNLHIDDFKKFVEYCATKHQLTINLA